MYSSSSPLINQPHLCNILLLLHLLSLLVCKRKKKNLSKEAPKNNSRTYVRVANRVIRVCVPEKHAIKGAVASYVLVAVIFWQTSNPAIAYNHNNNNHFMSINE
uniref:Uncharacterized protein n=1 Tax=Glossina austeni TaxID=7395 RepID=A0A1A9UPA0_GLOAU